MSLQLARTSAAPRPSASRSRRARAPRADVAGSVVELGLAEAGVVGRVGEQRRAAPASTRLVEQLAQPPRAVPSIRPDRSSDAPSLLRLAQQVVEPADGRRALAQQVAQRRRAALGPSRIRSPSSSSAAADVVRRGQRVGAVVVRAVAVAGSRPSGSAVDRAAAAGHLVLVDPAGEVQALERELEARGHEPGDSPPVLALERRHDAAEAVDRADALAGSSSPARGRRSRRGCPRRSRVDQRGRGRRRRGARGTSRPPRARAGAAAPPPRGPPR